WAEPGTAFPAADHPIDPGNVEVVQRAEERLRADEPNRRGYLPKRVSAPGDVHVLDRTADPDVFGPGKPMGHPSDSFRALGKQLKLVLRRPVHHLEHTCDHVVREVGVEHVRHAVDEYTARGAPRERLLEPFRPEPGCERICSIRGG